MPIATVRSFSSASSIRLTRVGLTSEEDGCHTAQLRCRECELVVRRGSNLILHLTVSASFSSSYTITLTFIPVHGPRERSSIFKASGRGRDINELWLKISLPPNFPVGKYDAHVAMSVQTSVEVLTHMLHSAVTVLFNPWHQGQQYV